MIKSREVVEQTVDGEERVLLIKEVVAVRALHRWGMVRKRRIDPIPNTCPILLVHGFAQNRYVWHATTRSFSAYLAAKGFDVYNMDLRGRGRSSGEMARALSEMVEEDLPACANVAMRLSQRSSVLMIGHSMGGILSMRAAASSLRGSVSGVVTIGSPYQFGQGSALLTFIKGLARVSHRMGVTSKGVPMPARVVSSHLRRRWRIWNNRLVPLPIRAWAPGSMEAALLEEYLERAFDQTSLSVMIDLILAYEESAASQSGEEINAFEALDIPFLVIAGKQDHIAPPESVRPAYAASQSTRKAYRLFPGGHADLILGRTAPLTVWPCVSAFAHRYAYGNSQQKKSG